MLRDAVVLDTSVLVSDPDVWSRFPDDDVVVPLTVILELDKLKTRQDSVGANARAVLRGLEDLRVANDGDLARPAKLASGGTLRVLTLDANFVPEGLAASTNDNRIIATALQVRATAARCRLISSDTALRILASQFGLECADHSSAPNQLDTGWVELEVDGEIVSELHELKKIPFRELPAELHLQANRFAVLKAGDTSALVRSKNGQLLRLNGAQPWGLRPRSAEQRFALDLLCDPDVPLVALSGRSGTGKTLLSLAAGLDMTLEADRTYQHLAIFRPIIPVGRAELGFLPGEQNAKLAPWMSAIEDQISVLSPRSKQRRSDSQKMSPLEEYQLAGRITCESVTYLRGRSLHGHYVIVDEAQNLSRATVKTILTRAAEGSKIVLLGDINQIDDPYLSATDNGLVALMDAFRDQDCFGYLALQRCERAQIADLADKLM